MASPLSFLIGLRFIYCHHRGSMVSFISMISTAGIAFSVAILIIGLSAMNGFEYELSNRILSAVPHGEIEPVNQPWKDWHEVLKKVKEVPGIIVAEPYISFTGLVESRANLLAIQVRGVNLQQGEHLSMMLPRFAQSGLLEDFMSDRHQIIVGKGIADELKVRQGDLVSIMIPNATTDYKIQKPRCIRLYIIGILQLNSQLDYNLAIVPLEDARQYVNMGDSVTGIAVKVNSVFDAKKLVRDASRVTNSFVHIKSWIDTYGYMYRDIRMIRTIIYLAMALIIGIACFNIVSTLVMAVKDKRSDIAILRTLGARDSLIRTIFVWYGLLVGLIGSLCGVVIGVTISLRLTLIVDNIEKLIGHQFLSSKVYFIDFLPSELHWVDVFYVLIVTLLLSLLASWYPARRASRIDPVNILSGR